MQKTITRQDELASKLEELFFLGIVNEKEHAILSAALRNEDCTVAFKIDALNGNVYYELKMTLEKKVIGD